MRLHHTLCALALLAALSAPTGAQSPTAAAEPRAASAPATGCPATAKRHDHGAERQAPGGASTLCPKGDTAAAAKTKNKPAHDHTRVHKTL